MTNLEDSNSPGKFALGAHESFHSLLQVSGLQAHLPELSNNGYSDQQQSRKVELLFSCRMSDTLERRLNDRQRSYVLGNHNNTECPRVIMLTVIQFLIKILKNNVFPSTHLVLRKGQICWKTI